MLSRVQVVPFRRAAAAVAASTPLLRPSAHITSLRSISPASLRPPLQRTAKARPLQHQFAVRAFQTSRPNRQYPYRYYQAQRLRSGFAHFFRRWSSRPTFYLEVGTLGVITSGFYISNLEVVPVSGRRRFNVISVDLERQLGDQQYQQILEQFQSAILPDYDLRTIRVRRVLNRLIPNSGLPADYDWKVTVIDSPETNAFVIPGGKVFVFTGILPVCANDDGLATVLGHEIGHNVARHVAEQMSRGIVLVGIAWLVEIFWGIPGRVSQSLLGLAIDKPRSRAQESEADYIGLMMMAKSCYDPRAAVGLWQRMQVVEKKMGAPPEMLSTHPSSARRQEALTELLPKALEVAADAGCQQTHSYVDAFRHKVQDDFGVSF